MVNDVTPPLQVSATCVVITAQCIKTLTTNKSIFIISLKSDWLLREFWLKMCHSCVGWVQRSDRVTHALQLSAGEEAGQQQHPHGDGQQQHEGEGQRCRCRHDDPQQSQTCQLDESEKVHPQSPHL